MRRVSRLVSLLILGVVASLIGCGGNPLGRENVEGVVTLDGQALDQGMISFEPKQRGEGRVGSGTTIKDGRYAIPAEKGLPPGEYLVRIHSSATAGGPKAGGGVDVMPGLEAGGGGYERIPPQYNSNSTLSVTIPKGGSDEINFDLKSR